MHNILGISHVRNRSDKHLTGTKTCLQPQREEKNTKSNDTVTFIIYFHIKFNDGSIEFPVPTHTCTQGLKFSFFFLWFTLHFKHSIGL